MKTETELKYDENIRFNLETAKSLRIEIAKYIVETKVYLSTIDGRKKTEIETITQRIEKAIIREARLKEEIEWLDTMETLTNEAALIDDQISALVTRRKSLIDITKPDPFKTKWHGMI